jgi:hypothetical protein
LNRSSITPEIVKNLRRGQTVTVQKWTVTVQKWTVTVQALLMSDFDYLRGRTRFFPKHKTYSLMSYLSNAINFA